MRWSISPHADISKAKALLEWQPETPIGEGLQVFADWVTDDSADRPVGVTLGVGRG